MLFLRSAAHHDVVKICECAFTTTSFNDVNDDMLKTRNSVFQAKRNPLKLVQLAIRFESRIFSLFWQQRHLVVCRPEIQTRVPLVLSHVIDTALHVRQRISIKACEFVDSLTIIYTHTLPVLFIFNDHELGHAMESCSVRLCRHSAIGKLESG